jgi:hypothetical protein
MGANSMIEGWQVSNKHEFACGTDKNESHSGHESLYLKSIVPRPKDFGFIHRSMNPDNYRGNKLTMSAWIKTMIPDRATVQLWIRVDGDWKERAGCFDNMYDNRIKGTTDWRQYSVQVDVPLESTQIIYGAILNGTGQVWLDEFSFEQ